MTRKIEQHTPPPWHLQLFPDDDTWGYHHIHKRYGPGGRGPKGIDNHGIAVVMDVPDCYAPGEAEANARLINEAPAMLGALQALLAAMEVTDPMALNAARYVAEQVITNALGGDR